MNPSGGILKLSYPTTNGIIQDWADTEKLWTNVYNELNVAQDQHPVLLTESPLNPKNNRAKCAEVFFESFNVPSLLIQMQSILSLYGSIFA